MNRQGFEALCRGLFESLGLPAPPPTEDPTRVLLLEAQGLPICIVHDELEDADTALVFITLGTPAPEREQELARALLIANFRLMTHELGFKFSCNPLTRALHLQCAYDLRRAEVHDFQAFLSAASACALEWQRTHLGTSPNPFTASEE